MRPNLISRLKEEWNNLDPVDPLRGLIADAIDALTEQPASKPLALEQIAKVLADAGLRPEDYREDGMIEPLVRAIEAAHGIKGDA